MIYCTILINIVVEKSTVNAAKNVRAKMSSNIDEVTNCQVSINGVVTVISSLNGKCLYVHFMSKNCFGCKMWEHKNNSQVIMTGLLTTYVKPTTSVAQVQWPYVKM